MGLMGIMDLLGLTGCFVGGALVHDIEEVLSDVAAAVFALPGDAVGTVVAFEECLGEGFGEGGGADDTAPVGEEGAVGIASGAAVEDEGFVVVAE